MVPKGFFWRCLSEVVTILANLVSSRFWLLHSSLDIFRGSYTHSFFYEYIIL